jgi:hypothetical protein
MSANDAFSKAAQESVACYRCKMKRVSLLFLLTSLACAQKDHQPSALGGKPQPAKVETSVRSTDAKVILAGISEKTRAEIGKSPVPVLWPSEGLVGAVFVGEQVYYSVSGYQDLTLPNGEVSRATVTVQGTSVTHNEERVGNVQNLTVHGQRAHIARNEEIVTTTWVEGGVYYAVDVECSKSGVDERCSRDTFVRAVADGLVRLGGAR